MRLILIVVIAPVLLSIAGCTEMPRTTYNWVRSGGDMASLNADWRDCVNSNSFGSRVVDTKPDGGQVRRADGVDPKGSVECMKARGWMLDGTKPG